MNLAKQVLVFVIAAICLCACDKAQFKKTKGGMPYQVYKGKNGKEIKAGDFLKVHLKRKVKDSLYFSTFETLPAYIQVTETPQPYDISELWTELRVGDSVVATQMLDTFIKRNPQSVPPEFKKGDKITVYLKIVDVFSSDSLARADYEKVNKAWLEKEIIEIEKFLADKKITAQKTPGGTFVQMLTPGTGEVIDSGKYVVVNYTGTSWSGTKFDSNTDPAFSHVAPYPFVVGTGSMIKGFDEAVQLMRKGSKAKIYIPSVLAYGGNPTSPAIKPYEHLIFDLEIVDVKDRAPAQPGRDQHDPNLPPGGH